VRCSRQQWQCWMTFCAGIPRWSWARSGTSTCRCCGWGWSFDCGSPPPTFRVIELVSRPQQFNWIFFKSGELLIIQVARLRLELCKGFQGRNYLYIIIGEYFFTVRYSELSLIFAAKSMNLLLAKMKPHAKGRLLALPVNILLEWKWLTATNTLLASFFDKVLRTTVKIFILKNHWSMSMCH
jgi:hypothetical protein